MACKYGRYDIANLLLRKFGSNSLDLNMVDFKGRTSFDLAWNWLININNSQGINITKANNYIIKTKLNFKRIKYKQRLNQKTFNTFFSRKTSQLKYPFRK